MNCMKRVCENWEKEAFTPDLISPAYWDAFAENAKAASAEIHCVKDEAAAAAEVEKIAEELDAKEVIVAGDDTDTGINAACEALSAAGRTVYRDKFEVAEHAPTAPLGLSRAEFAVGETGSVVVDTYSYEARVVGMLPMNHIVLLDASKTTENVTTAFQVFAKVFKRGYLGFITGPSRTADIERVLSLGVHGPHRFFVVAIGKEEGK